MICLKRSSPTMPERKPNMKTQRIKLIFFQPSRRWLSAAPPGRKPRSHCHRGTTAPPNRQSVRSFVKEVTDKLDLKFVAPEDRIATFDQDGTSGSSTRCTRK